MILTSNIEIEGNIIAEVILILKDAGISCTSKTDAIRTALKIFIAMGRGK